MTSKSKATAPSKSVPVRYTLGKPRRYFLGTDLSEREIHGIGLVTVYWAQLEDLILSSTLELSNSANVAIPVDANSLSFKRRLRAWRQLVEARRTSKRKLELLKLHDRIANAESKRHKITHGLWDYDVRNPAKLVAIGRRVPHTFVEGFDADKLIGLGDEIAEICFVLHFPKGAASLKPSVNYMSRGFMQMMMGQERTIWPGGVEALLQKLPKGTSES